MDVVRLLECFGCLAGDPSDIVTAVRTKNPELVTYLQSLVGGAFQGETSNVYDSVSDHNELWKQDNLGAVLYSMDKFIRSKGELFTGNEDEFLRYMHQAAKQRCLKGHNFKSFHKKMLRDKTRFVELYRRRGTGQLARKVSTLFSAMLFAFTEGNSKTSVNDKVAHDN